jgi:hypothetical protein
LILHIFDIYRIEQLVKERQFYIFIILVVISLCPNLANGQVFNPYQHAYQGWNGGKIRKASPVRAFLNKFSLNVSLGYGRTFYSHVVNEDVLETESQLTMLGDYNTFGDSISYMGVIDWLNAPTVVNGEESIGTESRNNILYQDSSEIRYGGSGYNIPVKVSLLVDIERFSIGGGIVYEIHGINKLYPKGQGTYPYIPNFSKTTMFRYYLTLGAKVYHLKGWDYHVNIEIGKVKYGPEYDQNALQNGLYFNLGVPIEYEFSEYFWIFLRPSFDFKNYTMTLTQDDGITASSADFQHNLPAIYLNFGVRMKLPEVKKCPVKACKIQLKHVHGGREFRGQPFYKKQNPKIGELRRKQGEYSQKSNRKTKAKN